MTPPRRCVEHPLWDYIVVDISHVWIALREERETFFRRLAEFLENKQKAADAAMGKGKGKAIHEGPPVEAYGPPMMQTGPSGRPEIDFMEPLKALMRSERAQEQAPGDQNDAYIVDWNDPAAYSKWDNWEEWKMQVEHDAGWPIWDQFSFEFLDALPAGSNVGTTAAHLQGGGGFRTAAAEEEFQQAWEDVLGSKMLVERMVQEDDEEGMKHASRILVNDCDVLMATLDDLNEGTMLEPEETEGDMEGEMGWWTLWTELTLAKGRLDQALQNNPAEIGRWSSELRKHIDSLIRMA